MSDEKKINLEKMTDEEMNKVSGGVEGNGNTASRLKKCENPLCNTFLTPGSNERYCPDCIAKGYSGHIRRRSIEER